MTDFSTFFSAACGSDRQPYAYQVRLAEGSCESRLITIPTGLGKTATTAFGCWMRRSSWEWA